MVVFLALDRLPAHCADQPVKAVVLKVSIFEEEIVRLDQNCGISIFFSDELDAFRSGSQSLVHFGKSFVILAPSIQQRFPCILRI